MTTTTITLAQFIERLGITMTAQQADRNPNMDDDGSPMDHWKCVLRLKDGATQRRLTIHFSKGVGLHGAAPTADEVLDCLASDAAGIENASSFEDWCSEYGYDTDSRKTERTFKACEREARKLKAFLSTAAYETILWNTDRL